MKKTFYYSRQCANKMLQPCFGWEGSIQIGILLFGMLSIGIRLILLLILSFSFSSCLPSFHQRMENATPFSSHITRFASPPPVFCSFIMPSHNSAALSHRRVPLMTDVITGHDGEESGSKLFCSSKQKFRKPQCL